MELNATVSIGFNGKLEYRAVHGAGNMTDNSLSRLEALTIAHKAIEEAVAKANDTLEENGLTAKLADQRCDEYGNVTVGDRLFVREDVADKTLDKEELKVRLIE